MHRCGLRLRKVAPVSGEDCFPIYDLVTDTSLTRLGADTVTILVGPEGSEEKFLILGDLAKQHSQTIETKVKALTGTEDATLHMSEYSASNFKIFVSFIYTGKLYTMKDSKENLLLGELWILGQALKSTTLRDAVTDAMIEWRTTAYLIYSDAYIDLAEYLQTKQQTRTGMGKLLVDTAITSHQHRIYTDARSTKPECLHFFGEVIMGLDRARRGVESENKILSRARTGIDCVYHEHGTSGICYKNMFPVTKDALRKTQEAMPR